jgi:hypothetical protein
MRHVLHPPGPAALRESRYCCTWATTAGCCRSSFTCGANIHQRTVQRDARGKDALQAQKLRTQAVVPGYRCSFPVDPHTSGRFLTVLQSMRPITSRSSWLKWSGRGS